MRLSTYNVENLFARAKALRGPGGQPQILAAQAEINQIIAQPVYSAGDKQACACQASAFCGAGTADLFRTKVPAITTIGSSAGTGVVTHYNHRACP